MADLKPETGLVFRYDFVFRDEHARGIDSGKERPCAIIVASAPDEQGARKILAAPITHTPPARAQDGVEIPHKLARHLGLDDDRMWVKVNDLNRFTWEEDRIPVGIVPVSKDQPAHGFLPPRLRTQIKQAVLEHAKDNALSITGRDELIARQERAVRHRQAHRTQDNGNDRGRDD